MSKAAGDRQDIDKLRARLEMSLAEDIAGMDVAALTVYEAVFRGRLDDLVEQYRSPLEVWGRVGGKLSPRS